MKWSDGSLGLPWAGLLFFSFSLSAGPESILDHNFQTPSHSLFLNVTLMHHEDSKKSSRHVRLSRNTLVLLIGLILELRASILRELGFTSSSSFLTNLEYL